MPSSQNVAKSTSPVLFMSVEGEPMPFFLRPGPLKRELQPLITAGGGMVCKVQQPGAILLIDPKEKGSIPEATAHWYVSAQYILDCVEKDEQLNLEDYRLNPDVTSQPSSSTSKKESPAGHSGGRTPYTPEDDEAILQYVGKHKSEVGGNRLWMEMEKQKVTIHSWQSMKYRYRARLVKKLSQVMEDETTETTDRESKVEEKQETDVEKPSSVEDGPPQIQSAESELTQIDSPSVLADNKQAETVEAQASNDLQKEGQLSPQTEKQPHESTQQQSVEADASSPSQHNEPTLDSEADFHLHLSESMGPETEERQTTIQTQKESVTEDSPAAHSLSLPESPSQKKSKEKQKASPEPEQPQRRLTRRRLQLEESSGPEPYGKKLRSSSSPAPSSQPLRKTKQALMSTSNRKDTAAEEPPSKRARGKSEAATQDGGAALPESQPEESGPAEVQETGQPETESISLAQKGKKKTEKRELGILEAATKEFEDDSESGGDEAPDLQNETEKQPKSTDPTPNTAPNTAADAADGASTQSDPEPGRSPQTVVPETQTSTNCAAETGSSQAAAAEPAAAQTSQTEDSNTTCKPHLFIFDNESQEEDFHSVDDEDPAAPSNTQPTVSKDAPYSLTQAQLEEDKKRITELMKQTNQNLFNVTKALLKTSGDFSAARDLLLNPGVVSGPFWNRHDDSRLLSADPEVRQELQEKYGEENLVKRIVFLEVER